MCRQYPAVGGLAGLGLRFEHDRAGAIAEQHAGAAVGPVENTGEGFGADHQSALERAGTQEIVGSGEREDKSGAYRLQIERRAVVDAEFVLHRDRGGGKGVIRRRGGQHDQVDRLRVDPGIGQRGASGMNCQMRGELAFGGDVALPDTGSLHDPFVGRVDPRSQFGIGQDLARQIGAAAEHHRTHRSHETASCAVGASALPSRLSI